MFGEEKTEYKFKCGWCKKEFKQKVGTGIGGKHGKVTDQVKCPRCGNYVPSWGGK